MAQDRTLRRASRPGVVAAIVVVALAGVLALAAALGDDSGARSDAAPGSAVQVLDSISAADSLAGRFRGCVAR